VGDERLADGVEGVHAQAVPAAGRVMVTVSGNFELSGGHFAQCSLTTGANIEGSGRVEAQTSAGGTTFVPFSITRTFAVAAAGTFTANYNCRKNGASGVFAYEVQTSALFVAQ
jgi:hypothetical protein